MVLVMVVKLILDEIKHLERGDLFILFLVFQKIHLNSTPCMLRKHGLPANTRISIAANKENSTFFVFNLSKTYFCRERCNFEL